MNALLAPCFNNKKNTASQLSGYLLVSSPRKGACVPQSYPHIQCVSDLSVQYFSLIFMLRSVVKFVSVFSCIKIYIL